MTEHSSTFRCFGGECTVIVSGRGAEDAVAGARQRLEAWHGQLSRFIAHSELSRLNADPRRTVPVSPILRRIVQAGIDAARRTDGLVDPTLLNEIERAGYEADLEAPGLTLDEALAVAPPRAAAARQPEPRWERIETDRRTGTVTRPPGTAIDPGGMAKGVFADEIAAALDGFDAYAVDCAGDIRIGGRSRIRREVRVASPFGADPILHAFHLERGAAATSGIGRRSWLDPAGRPAHHLLDPATGRPAFTGIVQATALAPTATEAEMLSKAALLSGPAAADAWLAHGGVVVLDDGSYEVLTDAETRTSSQAAMSSST